MQPYNHLASVNSGCCAKCTVSSDTKCGQKFQAAKIVCFAAIPILTLIIQSGINLRNATSQYTLMVQTKSDVLFSIGISNLIQNLQLERGWSTIYVTSDNESVLDDKLFFMYEKTNASISSLDLSQVDLNVVAFENSFTFLSYVQKFRDEIETNTSMRTVLEYYSNHIDVILNWMARRFKEFSGDQWRDIVSYYMIILSKEQMGVGRALGASYYSKGMFSPEDHMWYTRKQIMGSQYLERAGEFSDKTKAILKEKTSTKLNLVLSRMTEELLSNNISRVASISDSVFWFDSMTEYINILKNTHDTLAHYIITGLDDEISNLRNEYVVSIIILLGVIILFPFITVVIYQQTNKIQVYAKTLQQKAKELEIERRRSEAVLYELLPVTIAKKLMCNTKVMPQHYSSASIFFSDIVGFTSICSMLTPLQVIDMLNLLYKTFDDLLEQYDVYKVETIGDAYMVVSGVPQPNGERHVIEISNLALHILKDVPQIHMPQLTSMKLQVRIGINTGSLVAGIVGYKMPRYCLFGDTVNVASRMESTGKPQRIQISTTTKEALAPFPHFITQERGIVAIKGKGMMETHWLLSNGAQNDE